MNRILRQSWKAAALAIGLASFCTPGRAALPPAARHARQQLAAVRAQIQAIARRRSVALAKRDMLGAELRRDDLRIAAARRSLGALRAAALAASHRLDALRLARARNQRSLDAGRTELAGQIVAAYMIGRGEQLKLLLSQTDIARAGRMLAYYGYFARARTAQITAIRDRMRRLAALSQDAGQEALHLRNLRDDAGKELLALDAARRRRAAALLATGRQLKTSEQNLAALRRQAQSVESLIQDLSRVMRALPVGPRRNFAVMRGRLPWPVKGRLVAHFHDVRMQTAQGSLRWNGVLIATPPGARVRATYYGRVAYADWLRGLGMLMIISHGNGYLSLYAHAEVLYKALGDRVVPGEVIAAMSNAPGPPPQLYFEIREGRKPLDPQFWLKGLP
ncbi:MAG: peptidoglycan DD-metalloendopeptidase family protein [Steroidobacteraceae bacterium]|nr:peptidoglycan DD-metalloendopeptidase family protein [Steroidobacteraceae bacterium]